jgi:hypothetical protein
MLDTADLKNALLQDYHDLKAGKITRSEARAGVCCQKCDRSDEDRNYGGIGKS